MVSFIIFPAVIFLYWPFSVIFFIVLFFIVLVFIVLSSVVVLLLLFPLSSFVFDPFIIVLLFVVFLHCSDSLLLYFYIVISLYRSFSVSFFIFSVLFLHCNFVFIFLLLCRFLDCMDVNDDDVDVFWLQTQMDLFEVIVDMNYRQSTVEKKTDRIEEHLRCLQVKTMSISSVIPLMT